MIRQSQGVMFVKELPIKLPIVCDRNHCISLMVYLVGKILFAPFLKPCHGEPVPRSLIS